MSATAAAARWSGSYTRYPPQQDGARLHTVPGACRVVGLTYLLQAPLAVAGKKPEDERDDRCLPIKGPQDESRAFHH
jgi:hypothetical protein